MSIVNMVRSCINNYIFVYLYSIDAVDLEHSVVYFSSNKDNATEKHLYSACLLPEGTTSAAAVINKITTEPGWHNCTVHVSNASGCYNRTVITVVDCFSSIISPLRMTVYRYSTNNNNSNFNIDLISSTKILDNAECGNWLAKPQFRESIIPPVMHTIRSTDGQVDLHCAVYLPPPAAAGRLWQPTSSSSTPLSSSCCPGAPAIISVYGGPHVQRVQNNWLLSADLRAQGFAQQGFVVIKCDNRGSFRRGLRFEGALRHDMGNIEVSDQVAAVQYFVAQGLIDAKRVGMFGWSYGGYMSAMSICRAPSTFACAVAGAPVTSWDGYDSHYTGKLHFNYCNAVSL